MRTKEGDEDMNEQERTEEEGQTTGVGGGPELKLPTLSADQKAWAEKPDQKAWAVGMARYGAGYVWTMPDVGMAMQVYDETTFRLLTLIEHDYFIEAAALVKATLESVGLQLDASQVVMAECTPWENGPTGPRQRGQGPAVEVV